MSNIRVYCPMTKNLGDFINVMPVFSGLAKSLGNQIRLVVSDNHKQIKGFKEFFNYQPMFAEVFFRSEVMGMEEDKYIWVHYSQEEFKNLTERPIRPIETIRHELFVRNNYPDLKWEVDDDLLLNVYPEPPLPLTGKIIVGDRWSKATTDSRRASNILRDCGHFNDESKFEFLDYENETLMQSAQKIFYSDKPFVGTFTGSGMLSDILGIENYCLYADDMLDPPWNDQPIIYSYWKHYYRNRRNKLAHIHNSIFGKNNGCN